ncbi:thioesterase family protein [Microvirga puerhi]|uniref:Thioesterase family protein n=1 Tax=Microvirga puerhi TaxID=2876078 RepID=A0ABS7VJP9_9HYPH|nr:thioesterase family protein [Microvirga puerhi]MBZ6075247.1 thioesterase family protein [Microvirga puerhi]
MDERAPVFFFAPFVSSTMRVQPSWIDYNGHMNMAYYHVLFDRAVEEAFGLVGLGQEYLEERNASFFAAETHTLYKRELRMRDTVRVTLQLIDFDEKRLHFYMEIRHATEGWLSATAEGLSLHVDMKTRKVAPFPDDILANLAIMKATHSRLATPQALGRIMGIPGRSEASSPLREPLRASGTCH